MVMLYGNVRSKIMHLEGCGFAKRIAKGNAHPIRSSRQARAKGYRFCHCCDPLRKTMREEGDKLKGRLELYEYPVLFEEDKLRIKSNLDEWYVISEYAGKLSLYHRNTRGDLTGYHRQKQNFKSVSEILDNISNHDAYRTIHPTGGVPVYRERIKKAVSREKKRKGAPNNERNKEKAAARHRDKRRRQEEERDLEEWLAYEGVTEDYAYVG